MRIAYPENSAGEGGGKRGRREGTEGPAGGKGHAPRKSGPTGVVRGGGA
jgi:hypothetical protein